MRKASLLLILLVGGLLFAQGGVRVSAPLDGTTTSNSVQPVTYFFDRPTSVDPTSLVLSINGTHYDIGDVEIFWSTGTPGGLVFTPRAAEFTDGEVVACTLLTANTFAGTSVAGIPLASSFTVDLSAPYMVDYTPDDGSVVADPLTPIVVYLNDLHGAIDEYSVRVDVNGTIFELGDLGVTWVDDFPYVFPTGDTLLVGAFTIDPTTGGFAWDRYGFVNVHLYGVTDIVNYGTANLLSYYDDTNRFRFMVDDVGPVVTAVQPLIGYPYHPTHYIYTSCSDLQVTFNITDPAGIDISSFVARIRGAIVRSTDPKIDFNILDADTIYTIDILTGDTTAVRYIDYTVQVVYTPSPQYRDGELIQIELLAVNDIYGNPLESIDFPSPWLIFVDRTGPTVTGHFPEDGITTTNVELPVGFTVTEPIGIIDQNSVHMIIETSSGYRRDFNGIDGIVRPFFSFDGTTFTYNPADDPAFAWTPGDTVFVTAYNVSDLSDFCPGNEMLNDPITWHFYVANGPYPVALYPLDHEYSSCQNQPVAFTFINPGAVNPATVRFSFDGDVYSTTTEVISEIIPRWLHVGSDSILIEIDTVKVRPLVNHDGMFIFTPPSFLYPFVDAQEVEVGIVAASDTLGNPMWDAPVYWSFIFDFSAPYIASFDPAAGSYAGGPVPPITINFGDDVSGLIDLQHTVVTINGTYFMADMFDPADYDPSTRTLVIDPSLVGLSFIHNQVVRVCVTHLYDAPQNGCTTFANRAAGLPFCWTFTVDNNAPEVSVIEPLVDTYTSCPRQNIVFKVLDNLGINYSDVIIQVQGVTYTISSPELYWSNDTTLVFAPSRDWRNGEVVTYSILNLGDINGNYIETYPTAFGGSFIVDRTAPVVTGTFPADGEEVVYMIDNIATTVEDVSGINWEATVLNLTVGATPYTFTWADGFFTVTGNTINFDVVAAGINVAAGGEPVTVAYQFFDDPEYFCPSVNTLNYEFGFNLTPGWKVHLVINDVDTIVFGAVLGADNDLDVFDLQAAPPLPDFYPATFLLDGGTRLVEDMKDIETGEYRWAIWTGSEDICISWDPTELPPFGSFIINGVQDMRNTTSTTFCAGSGETVFINHDIEFLTIYRGWNLVSSPVDPIDPSPEAVFPMAAAVWEWDALHRRYITPTEIIPGFGYFVLYIPGAGDPDVLSYVIPGTPVYEYHLNTLRDGWNAIGSVYNFGGVDITDPEDLPDISVSTPVYSYNTSSRIYDASDRVYPGLGYWSFVNLPEGFTLAELWVRSWKSTGMAPESNILWNTNLNINGQLVTVGEAEGSISYINRLVPPSSPDGETVNAYIDGDVKKTVEYKASGDAEWTLVVNSASNVNFVSSNLNGYEVTLDDVNLEGNGNISLNPGSYTIRAKEVVKPVSYALHQNSPNPFNSATKISFDIPEESNVVLNVYDVLGKNIATIADGNYSAGTHSVTWDGKDSNGKVVSTGVYFYSINAGTFSSKGKMIYAK